MSPEGDAPGRRGRHHAKAALLASAGLSLLFVLVYSATNALASGREDLGTWFFAWEESIPVVPWMIVPYMSIDLFFVVAPFVCASVAEIKMLARRIATAVLVSGAIFALWPLRLGFERPEVTGVFGPVFAFLHGFDEPHNLFPSLHVALMFILRWTYHRHVRGRWRILLHLWFVLITASTVLTGQHHVIDVLGGGVLAVAIFHVFPTGLISRTDVAAPRRASPRLALWFGAGAAAMLAGAIAALFWHWAAAWTLTWIGVSLGVVSAGYAGLGPRVFRKYAGYLSIPARIVLGPYLFGLWLSRLWYWRRETTGYASVGDGVLLGRLPDPRIGVELVGHGVRSIIDLCAEHSEPAWLRGPGYRCFPILDLSLPDAALLDEVADEIERGRADGPVYVHCGLGFGRSGLAVAWWLFRTGRVPSLEAAARTIAEKRPGGVTAERMAASLQTIADGA